MLRCPTPSFLPPAVEDAMPRHVYTGHATLLPVSLSSISQEFFAATCHATHKKAHCHCQQTSCSHVLSALPVCLPAHSCYAATVSGCSCPAYMPHAYTMPLPLFHMPYTYMPLLFAGTAYAHATHATHVSKSTHTGFD